MSFFEGVESIRKIEWSDCVVPLFKLGAQLSKNSVLLLRIHGVNMLGFLFWGLRKQMKKGFKSMLKDLLSMLRDKKSSMIKALVDTLCAGYFIIGPKELYEEIRLYNTQRNKDIRLNILMMTERLVNFAFEENQVRDFMLTFMGMFISYSEDKDISVKRKLMGLLKTVILRGRKDLGKSLVEWMEYEISKQVKGSQKMIQSLGDYSPSREPVASVDVTSLHKIEIESPQTSKPASRKKTQTPSSKLPSLNSNSLSFQSTHFSVDQLIQNLQNGSLELCESSVEKLIIRFSQIGSKNPLFGLSDSSFGELVNGVKFLLRNPANSDELGLMVVQLLTLLFDKLNSAQNNIAKRNIKRCLAEIWNKSRTERKLIQKSVFNLLSRIGNNKFYFSEWVKTGVALIGSQSGSTFNVQWNSHVVTLLSCLDWFAHSNLAGIFSVLLTRRQKVANFPFAAVSSR